MGPKEEQKAVVVAPTNQLSAELMSELAKDAGAGLENVRPEDMAVPFLVVLQKNSPQVDEVGGSYVEGAKVGQFLETGTQTVYDEVQLIPCSFKTMFVEWHPRETGGGFVGQHEPGYEQKFQKNERGQYVTDAGTLLVQTMYFFCLLLQQSGDPLPVIVSFTSSQLKKARTWVTRLTSKTITPATGPKFKPPIYEMIWKMSTVPEENEKGSWRGVKIDVMKNVDDMSLFKAAREARNMFERAGVKIGAPVTPNEEG